MRSDSRLYEIGVEPFELTERRRINQELNIAEHRDGASELKSMPLVLFIELTQNCNLSCPMCRFGSKYTTEWNMSEEMYEKLADELFPTAHVVDLRGWGESTMLPGFGRFVELSLRHRVQLRLVTNGMVNRRPVWDMMMRAHAAINISCDAADPELFKKLRAGGTVERLANTTRSLVEARDKHGAPRDSVKFITTVSRDNLQDLVNVVELAARLDVERVILHPLVTHLDDSSGLHHDLDGTAEAYTAAAERGRREGVVVQLDAAPDPALALPDMVRRPACMHPWSYAYVRYNGGVGFCDHMLGDDQYTLGSLQHSSFPEIWNGADWVGIRKAHLTGDIPDRFSPCRWTYGQRYIDFEHTVHPDRAAGMVSTETHDTLIQRRDPKLFPTVPWSPDLAGDAAPATGGDPYIPVEYLGTRLRAMEQSDAQR
ncbi:radical SAM protein [Streptomyces anulatus]|uniref:radical SAM protein n=1 Tax=Streptomyces anulatus TaxID=1892 RepID=UPI0034131061